MSGFLSVPRYFSILIVVLTFNVAAFAQTAVQSPLPPLTGPYSVGRMEFDWMDTARVDPDSPSGHREIVVWVWYPASPKPGAEPAEWMPGKWGDLFAEGFVKRYPYPDATEMLKKYPIHSILCRCYEDAPVASGNKKYPVLLFAPGSGGVPLAYQSVIEDITSHGNIVAGIVPTYYSGFTVLSNGRVPEEGNRMDEGVKNPEEQQKRREDATHVWVGDLQFTLNELEKLDKNSKSSFHEKLDLQQVGAFGHSQGGLSSLQLAKDDNRVRAVFDVDGMLPPDLFQGGLPKPVLVLNSDHRKQLASAPRINPATNYDALVRTAKPGLHLLLDGSTHMFPLDFGIMPFLSASAKPGVPSTTPSNSSKEGTIGHPAPILGSIDPARALAITSTYIEAFFGEYLQGRQSSLWNGPSPQYPEIIFETNKK